jgi:hypothetical protein
MSLSAVPSSSSICRLGALATQDHLGKRIFSWTQEEKAAEYESSRGIYVFLFQKMHPSIALGQKGGK